MIFGKIAKEKFAYTSDMAYVYFLSDGFVYAAFNTTLPSGWIALTEAVFMEYTKEMYADSLTWGIGKPLIQIANTSRYGLVLLSNDVTDDSPLKVATASAVKLAYDIAVEAYNAVSASGEVGQSLFDSIRAAKDSKSQVVFGTDGTVTETVRNTNNDRQLATKPPEPERAVRVPTSSRRWRLLCATGAGEFSRKKLCVIERRAHKFFSIAEVRRAACPRCFSHGAE